MSHAPPPSPAGSERTIPFASTVLTISLTAMLVVGQLYVVIPLASSMSRDWDVTAGATTWTVSAFGFAYAIGFLFTGALSDRFGRRRLIVAGLSLTALSTAVMALAPSLTAALVLRALQGFTASAFAPAAFAYLAEHTTGRRRTTALTALTSSFLAAGVLGQVAAQAISDVAGWRAVFLIGAPAFLVAALATRRVLLPASTRTAQARPPVWRSMAHLVTDRRLVTLYLATATVLCSFVAVYTGLQLAGPSGLAGQPQALLALRASSLPALVLVALLAPRLSGLGGAVPRVAAALGVAAVAAAMAGPSGISLGLLGAVLFLFVAAIAVAAPGLVEAIGASAGDEARGAAVAIYTFALFVGASLGPQLARIAVSTGFGTLTIAIAGMLVAGALLTLGAAGPRVSKILLRGTRAHRPKAELTFDCSAELTRPTKRT